MNFLSLISPWLNINCQITTKCVIVSKPKLTTTEYAFVPGHLSRLPLGPGQKVSFVPGPKASRASGGDMGLLSRLEVPTRTKGPPFVPVCGSTRDKRPNSFIPVGNTNPDKRVTLLSWLVAPTRTKGPFCPGWCYQPGQKAPPRDSSKESYSLLSYIYTTYVSWQGSHAPGNRSWVRELLSR